jgi:hypothetical protein
MSIEKLFSFLQPRASSLFARSIFSGELAEFRGNIWRACLKRIQPSCSPSLLREEARAPLSRKYPAPVRKEAPTRPGSLLQNARTKLEVVLGTAESRTSPSTKPAAEA